MLKSLKIGLGLTLAALALPALAQEGPEMPALEYVLTESPDDHVIGAVSAPQTMIVYASVTCSHCGTWFSEQWPELKQTLVETDKLRFILRELPTPPAVLSMTGFAMAECASDEDYFKVIEYQMENQKSLFEQAQAGKGQEAYAKVGALAGLADDAQIETCLSDPSTLDHVRLSAERATAAGVGGVPAFYINGAAYDGPQEAEALIKLINEMDALGVTELPKTLPREAKDRHKDHKH